MKRWMKGIAIAGVTLLFIGTAITALAAAVGNVKREPFNTLTRNHIGSRVLERFDHAFGSGRDYDDDFYDYDDYDEYEAEPDLSEEWLNESDQDFYIAPKEEMKLIGSYRNITKIEIEAERAAVKIVENPELSDEIRVYMKEERYADVETDNDGMNNELSVDYSFAHGKAWPNKATGYTQGIVEVPAGYRFREAELKTKAGYMEAGNIHADELEAKAQAGEVLIGRFMAANAEFEVEAGSVVAAGDFSASLEAKAKAGAITVLLPGSENDYNYYIENAVGNVVIGDTVYSGLSNDKKINSGSGKTVEIDCAAGSAKIEFTGGN